MDQSVTIIIVHFSPNTNTYVFTLYCMCVISFIVQYYYFIISIDIHTYEFTVKLDRLTQNQF